MELVEGGTLASRVPAPGAADVETALAWLLPVIAAVCAAHAAGVVHRDLKPSNLLASFDARGGLCPKVSDFGISKLDDDTRELTGPDGLLGTPAYMAPEQMLDPRSAGPAADQYSLGVLLYLFATGYLPYAAPSALALMNRVVAGALTPPHERAPAVPRALGDVIAKALSPSPEARFPSAHALGVALLPFASARTRAIWAPDFEPDVSRSATTPRPPAPSTSSTPSAESTTSTESTASTESTLSAPTASSTETGGGEVVPSDTLDDRAPELPARGADVGAGRGSRRVGRVGRAARVAALALAGVLGGALLWRRAATGPGAFGAEGFYANASPAQTKVEGAAQAYRLGLAAMRNSAWEAGVEHFERATQLDPEFGAAHLRLAMAIASPEPPARRALVRARVLREGLSERDRVFLEALEASYFAPSPSAEAYAAPLRAGLARFPRDAELTMHLAIALQAVPSWAEAEQLADRALSLEPGYPDALQTKARARAARGDLDGALVELARCTELAPLAVGCLRAQALVRAQAGRCDAMAPGLRRWSTVDPRAFEPQLMQAGLLAWEGKPWQAVEEAQRERWPRSAADERPRRELKDRTRLALYRNHYQEASVLLEKLGLTVVEDPDDETDDWATEHQMFALDAAGQPAAAARVAREYLARSAARAPAGDVAANVRLRAAALAYRAGLLDREAARATATASLGLSAEASADEPKAALGRRALVALLLARGRGRSATGARGGDGRLRWALAALPGEPPCPRARGCEVSGQGGSPSERP